MKYIGSPDSSVRPFKVNKIFQSPSGLLQLKIDEGSFGFSMKIQKTHSLPEEGIGLL